MRRLMPGALAVSYVVLPLYPTFIALTSVAFPGVSLLSRPATIALLGVGCLLAIYAISMLIRYPLQGQAALLVPLLTIFGACILAAFLGFDPGAGLLFSSLFGLGIVWHCAILRFYDDPGAATAIFWSYLLSGTAAAAAAIVMVVARYPVSQYTIQHGRATGTFILPGELAGYLIVFIPIAYAIARIPSGRALQLLARAAILVGVIALALTYSRAGWMGFVAAVAFLLAVQARRLRYGAGAAALAIGAGIAIVLLLFNAHHNPSEDYTRLSIWQAAVQIIDRFPLTGVGPFDFSRLYAIVRVPDGEPSAFHAHSLYLTFFAELGLAGVAAIAWTIWRFTSELRCRLAYASPAGTALALGAAAGLIGVAVQGLIDTVSVVLFGLWLPTMAFALAAAKSGARNGGAEAAQ